EGHVFPFIPLVILPSIFLSGLLIDTALLPEPVQFFSLILPLRYANNIITGIVYDDTTNSAMAMNFLYLMIYAFLLWLLAASTLKETD
ncbi:MAG: hypothetical protein RL732_1643, partial [Bacteroidota bacterium]